MQSKTSTGILAGTVICSLLLIGLACQEKRGSSPTGVDGSAGGRTAVARRAFQAAYPVFMHPRCVNCHPAGDAPLQGNDSDVHTQHVTRGPDGNGVYAAKCTNCHQSRNLPGAHMPPGNPSWRLPKPEMPLVFEGLSSAELCEQLKDPQKNGGRSLDQVLHHVSQDPLVGWGWDPGDGRALPPMSQQAFAVKVKEWIDNGASCPE